MDDVAFCWHDWHALEPVVFLYFPAMQAVQLVPFGPVKPKLQVQSVIARQLPLPVHDTPEFAGHVVQVPPFRP
jgi:hypothetical protein